MTRVQVYSPVVIARQLAFIRETLGENRGAWVEALQRISDGQPGDSWCMDYVSAVLWICYQGPAPLPRTGNCDVAYLAAKRAGYLVNEPAPGDVFFRVRPARGIPDGDAHHAGFITDQDFARVRAIAGNTSEDGLSSNGTGAFENWMPRAPSLRYARLPLSVA